MNVCGTCACAAAWLLVAGSGCVPRGDPYPVPECDDGETRACGSDVGACAAGTETCVGCAWGPCQGAVEPAPETCGDGGDEDCDGAADEGCCAPGLLTVETIEEVADGPGSHWSAIVVDVERTAHVTFTSDTSDDLRYARRPREGGWEIETVDAVGMTGWYPSMGLDPAGGLYVVYFAPGAGELRYARRLPGAGWEREAAVYDVVPNGTSMAVDPAGAVHVVFRDEVTPSYAWRAAGGGWTVETIAVNEIAGAWASLALDAAGVVHVTFQGEQTGALLHAARMDGMWSVEELDQFGFLGLNLAGSAIAAAGEDLRVAYYHSDLEDLRLAERPAGGEWAIATVESDGNVGRSAVLAGDAMGGLHAAYWDSAAWTKTLRYGRRAAGAATFTFADLATIGAEETKIALAGDTEGGAHVTWYDPQADEMRYAHQCP